MGSDKLDTTYPNEAPNQEWIKQIRPDFGGLIAVCSVARYGWAFR